MSPQPMYEDMLRQDWVALIDTLDLSDLQKRFLRLRWLDQVLWMGDRATKARDRYYGLRLTTIVGGVIIPALVGLNVSTGAGPYITWATFVIGLLVAISAALEEFFHYGERWRHYRRTAELLKAEGWEFFQSSGPYRRRTHAEAFPTFAGRVEAFLKRDVEVFVTEVVREKEREDEQEDRGEKVAAKGQPVM